MRRLLVSLLLVGVLSNCASTENSGSDYTLYLVRHAEKQAGGDSDPALDEAGQDRARHLAILLKDKGITDIWSSDYLRTRSTAAPLAAKLGLEVKIYDAKDLQTLVSQLKQRQHSALIVGHSNTTPELASLLCVCQVSEMQETEYDRLLVVSVQNDAVTLETLVQ